MPSITNNQAALDWLHRTFFEPERPGSSGRNGRRSSSPLDDEQLIERIRKSKQGLVFDRLFRGEADGDWSADDLRLCGILAFWTDRDPDRIDRIFRLSKRMRLKWDQRHSGDGRTYGEMTIDRAVNTCQNGYRAGKAGRKQTDSDQNVSGDQPPDASDAIASPIRRPGESSDDKSHHQIAVEWIESREHPGPIATDGRLYEYDQGLWVVTPRAKVETELGGMWGEYRLCQTKSHYKQIYQHIEDVQAEPDFFISAPVGMMTPGGFFEASAAGIVRRSASPELRQRFSVTATPKKIATPVFDRYLQETFADPDPSYAAAQKKLLQEVIGGALVGVLHEFEKAVYLYGRARAGKSTLLRILDAAVPKEVLATVSPYSWGNDYSRAALAGIRLNIVGELPREIPIPASDFKSILGRDRIQARNPYGRPFSFRPSAAHFVNSNHWICTKDQHPAFFDRWIMLGFMNSVPPEQRQRDLDSLIIHTELPGVLYWALEGATRLIRQQGFTQSPIHDDLLERWRNASDSVAAFMSENTVRIPGSQGIRRGHLYELYKGYCCDEERKPCGKHSFFGRVESLGYTIGPDSEGNYVVGGIALASRTRPRDDDGLN